MASHALALLALCVAVGVPVMLQTAFRSAGCPRQQGLLALAVLVGGSCFGLCWAIVWLVSAIALSGLTLAGLAALPHCTPKHLGDYRPTDRVAVVGAGPAGVTAAWALKAADPERDVTLIEAEPEVGGHSVTVTDEGVPLDIGFIFSSERYEVYARLLEKFDSPGRKASPIAVFSYPAGGTEPIWDNLTPEADPELRREVERFGRKVEEADRDLLKSDSVWDVLMLVVPLGAYLWWHDFSRNFRDRVLLPMLTPLFVTSRGSLHQSAGATLLYFKDDGYLSLHLPSQSPRVYHTVGGVDKLYEQMVTDCQLSPEQLKLSSPVSRVQKVGSQWEIWATGQDGRAKSLGKFDQVVMATSAKVAARALAGQPCCTIISWLLSLLDYSVQEATLYKEPNQLAEGYHAWPGGLLRAPIDKILHLAGAGLSQYILQVTPGDCSPDVAPEHNPDAQVLARRRWEHHAFDLWELILTRCVLPWFNHAHGIHLAGDYIEGVGQEDAVVSGLMAAKAVGLSGPGLNEVDKVWPQNSDPTSECQEQISKLIEGDKPSESYGGSGGGSSGDNSGGSSGGSSDSDSGGEAISSDPEAVEGSCSDK